MSLSFGGLGLLLRNPADVVGTVWGKGESMFWLIVFCIVFLVLAYLTNPSENSFRTFLTEQSFRQHLSRLDDNIDDHESEPPTSNRPSVRRNVSNNNAHTLSFDNRSPFHFANRASVSLRTPKHVFHSFGIVTIAAIIPVTKSERGAAKALENTSVICDSWYIGVFGRWWRGGVLETWYQDVFSRATDEESWSSGIMGMKTTERNHEFSALPGLPFSTKNLPPHLLARGSPPRLRNRDKSTQRSGLNSTRSSTPPPLPKSVSLPLHATRDQPIVSPPPLQPQSKSVYSESINPGPQGHSLATFDQSPLVADLLRQVSSSKASIVELHTQLNDCRLGASQSHAVLQQELESCRERKRQEDGVRNELKTRTKTLDDAKRQAEGSKREAEKRLKAAISARQDSENRIEHIDSEIARLHQCVVDDEAAISQLTSVESEAEQEIKVALEQRNSEINTAEDAVTAMNLRTRDLEEKLAAQKERLNVIRERMHTLHQSQHSLSFSAVDASTPQWTSAGLTYDPTHSPTESVQDYGDVFPDGDLSDSPSLSEQVAQHTDIIAHPVIGQGYSRRESPQLNHTVTTNFAPFADLDNPHSAALSPTTSSLIPSGLMSSLAFENDGFSRSFQSESDVFLDRHWRKEATVYGAPHRQHSSDEQLARYDSMQSSPTSLHGPGSDTEYDPFEVRMLPRERARYPLRSETAMDMQRASLFPRASVPAPTPTSITYDEPLLDEEKIAATPRRWFSTSRDKSAKSLSLKAGLNPDAQAFSAPRKTTTNTTARSSFDALNPHGLGHNHHSHHSLAGHGHNTSDSNTLLRAFAPSAAEREVLQRALGGSTNTSLERLPSLSDVGSIPPSPSHVHAQSTMDKIPAWLQSLPRIRKPTFSPWEEDEVAGRKSG